MTRDNQSNGRKPVLLIARSGLFAALIALATLVSIPIAGGHGFVNPGDAFILLSTVLLGGWHAVAASAVGSALADLLLGYTVFAPGTLIVKGLMALVAVLLARRLRSKLPAFLIAGLVMPAGYFLYEALIFSPAAAFAGVPWNLVQYAAGAVLGFLLSTLAERLHR